jgi:hypothetical protein
MPKFVSGARPRPRRPSSTVLPDAVEGQIAEICRDLAVQMKRMHQLQQQADELYVAIRQWARQSEPTSDRESASREGRR